MKNKMKLTKLRLFAFALATFVLSAEILPPLTVFAADASDENAIVSEQEASEDVSEETSQEDITEEITEEASQEEIPAPEGEVVELTNDTQEASEEPELVSAVTLTIHDGNTKYTTNKNQSGEGWQYVVTENEEKLFLTDFDGQFIEADGNLTIVLSGHNKLTLSAEYSATYYAAINVNGSLTIFDNGDSEQDSLTFHVESRKNEANPDPHKIMMYANEIRLKGGHYIVEGESNSQIIVFRNGYRISTYIEGTASFTCNVDAELLIHTGNTLHVNTSGDVFLSENTENNNVQMFSGNLYKGGTGYLSILANEPISLRFKSSADGIVHIRAKGINVHDDGERFKWEPYYKYEKDNQIKIETFSWKCGNEIYLGTSANTPIEEVYLVKNTNAEFRFMDNDCFDMNDLQLNKSYEGISLKNAVVGGNGTYSFKLEENSSLPSGLYLDSSAKITGKPTALTPAGSFKVVCTDTESKKTATIEINYSAVKEDPNSFMIGTKTFPYTNSSSGEGWSYQYNDGKSILTLENYDGGPVYSPKELTIIVKGDNNTLTVPIGSEYAISIGEGKLYVEEEDENVSNVLLIQTEAPLLVASTLLKSVVRYDDTEYVVLNGGKLAIEVESEDDLTVSNGRTVVNAGAELSMSVKSIRNFKLKGFVNGLVLGHDEDDKKSNVSLNASSYIKDSYLASEIIKAGSGTLTIDLPATDIYTIKDSFENDQEENCANAVKVVSNELIVSDDAGGEIVVSGFLHNAMIPKATWSIEGVDNFLWNYSIKLDTDTKEYNYICDSTGKPLTAFTLKMVGRQQLTFMDSDLFDISGAEYKVGSAMQSGVNWIEGVRGGNGTYSFALEEESVLPKGLEIDSSNGNLSGTLQSHMNNGSFGVKVASGDESASFTISYPSVEPLVSIEEMKFSVDEIVLSQEAESDVLSATILPDDADLLDVEWIFDDANLSLQIIEYDTQPNVHKFKLKAGTTPGKTQVTVCTVLGKLTDTLDVYIREEKPSYVKISSDKDYLTKFDINKTYQIEIEDEVVAVVNSSNLIKENNVWSYPIDNNWRNKAVNITVINSLFEKCNSESYQLNIPEKYVSGNLYFTFPTPLCAGDKVFAGDKIDILRFGESIRDEYYDSVSVDWKDGITQFDTSGIYEGTFSLHLKSFCNVSMNTTYNTDDPYVEITKNTSSNKIYPFDFTIMVKERTPEPQISKDKKYIIGLERDAEYIVNGSSYEAFAVDAQNYGIPIDWAWAGKEIQVIRKSAVEGCDSDVALLAIPTDLIPENLSLSLPAVMRGGKPFSYTDVKVYEGNDKEISSDWIVCLDKHENGINGVCWNPAIPGDTFDVAGEYTATIVLYATGGLTFPSSISNKNGFSVSNDGKYLTVENQYFIKEEIPEGYVNKELKSVTGLMFKGSYQVSFDNGAYSEVFVADKINDTNEIGFPIQKEWIGKQISLVKIYIGNNKCNSDPQVLTIDTDLISKELSVIIPAAKMDDKLAEKTDIVIKEKNSLCEITGTDVICKQVIWNPDVKNVSEGNLYTATITLEAVSPLTFPSDVAVFVNGSADRANVTLSDDFKTVEITETFIVKDKIPNAKISDDKEYLINLEENVTYIIENKEYVASAIPDTKEYGVAIDLAWAGKEISIVRKNHMIDCYSEAQLLNIPTDLIAGSIEVSFVAPILGEAFPKSDAVRIVDSVKKSNIKGIEADCEVSWLPKQDIVTPGAYEVTIVLTPCGALSFPKDVCVTLKDSKAATIVCEEETITITQTYYVKNATPVVEISPDKDYLINFISGETYIINEKEYVAEYVDSIHETGILIDLAWAGQELSIIHKHSINACNSEPYQLTVPTDLIAKNINVLFDVPELGKKPAGAEQVAVYDTEKNVCISGVETDCNISWSPYDDVMKAGKYEATITLTAKGTLTFPLDYVVTLNGSSSLVSCESNENADIITIKQVYYLKNAKPNAKVSDDKDYIVGLLEGEAYLVNEKEFIAQKISDSGVCGIEIDLAWAGKNIDIIQLHSVSECNSMPQTLSIPTDLIADNISIVTAVPEWDSALSTERDVSVMNADKNISIKDVEVSVKVEWSCKDTVVTKADKYIAKISLIPMDKLTFPVDTKISVNGEMLTVSQGTDNILSVEKAFYVIEKTPNGYLSEDAAYILGLEKGVSYLIAGTKYTAEYIELYQEYGVAVNPKWSSCKISVIKLNSISACNSMAQQLQIPFIAESVEPDYIPEMIHVSMSVPEYNKALSGIDDLVILADGEQNEMLTCASIVWTPTVSGVLTQAGKYSVTLTLAASEGMSFDENLVCYLNDKVNAVKVSEDGKMVVLSKSYSVLEKTPKAYVSSDKKYILGLEKNAKYLINNKEYTAVKLNDSGMYGVEIDLNWGGTEVSIVKVNAVSELNSIPQVLQIPSDLIEDVLSVNVPKAEMGKALAVSDEIALRIQDTDVKGVVADCAISWNPNVAKVEKGGIYTATISLSALNNLTFRNSTKIYLNKDEVKTVLSADARTVTFTYVCKVSEKKPEIYLYENKYLAGFEKDAEYTIDDVKYIPERIGDTNEYGVRLPLEWAGKTVSIVRLNSDIECNSEPQKLEIPSDLITKEISITMVEPKLGEALASVKEISVKDGLSDESLENIALTTSLSWNTNDDKVKKAGLYTAELTLSACFDLTFSDTLKIYVNHQEVDFEMNEAADEIKLVLRFYVKEKTPDVKLSADLQYVTGFEEDGVYLLDGKEMTPVWNTDSEGFVIAVLPEWAGQTIEIVKTNAYKECYSDVQLLSIPEGLISDTLQVDIPELVVGNFIPASKDVAVFDLQYNSRIDNVFVDAELSWMNEVEEVFGGMIYEGKLVLTAKGALVFAKDISVSGTDYYDCIVSEDFKTITIRYNVVVKELTPNAYVSNDALYIAGLAKDTVYLVNDVAYTTVEMEDGYGIPVDMNWRGTTVSLVKDNPVEACRSEAVALYIPMLVTDNVLKVTLPKPVYGEKPAALEDVCVKAGDILAKDMLSVVDLTWSPLVDDTFAKSVEYTALITLKTVKGYVFAEDTRFVTEGTNTSFDLSEDRTELVLSVQFSKTSGEGFWIEDIPDYVYTGKAIKPVIKVYYNDELLTKKDYSIAYKNNINAAAYNAVNEKGKSIAPTITIKGKGRFIGEFVKTFTIKPLDLNEYVTNEEMQDILSIEPVYARYTGKFIKTEPIVKLNGDKIAKNKQFRFEYSDSSEGAYIQNGVYEIKIVGLEKNMTGFTTTTMTISNKKIDKVSVSLDKKFIPYNKETGYTTPGKIVIKDGNKLLTEGVDYEISYLNHDKVGVANLVITGIGTYCGVKKVVYHILGTELKSENLKVLVKSRPYNMKAHSVSDGVDYYVKCNGEILKEGVDFTLEYTGNRVKQGNMPVKFKGINAYKGTFTYNFKISKIDVNKLDISLKNADTVYFSKGQTKPLPEVYFNGVLLTLNVDYKIVYKNYTVVRSANDKNAPQFHINGIGNFTGSTRENPYKFSIVRAPISECADISVYNVVYKNKKNNYVPKYKMFDKTNRNTLFRNADIDPNFIYEIWDESLEEFIPFTEKRVDASEHPVKMRVTFTGIKNYCGTASYEYFVCPKNIAASSIKVDKIPSVEYNGEAHTPIPVIKMKVKNGKKTEYIILDESNYTLEYSDNVNRGTATIKIVGRGEFAGERKVKFVIARKRISNK